jgi:hypothetical protein
VKARQATAAPAIRRFLGPAFQARTSGQRSPGPMNSSQDHFESIPRPTTTPRARVGAGFLPPRAASSRARARATRDVVPTSR